MTSSFSPEIGYEMILLFSPRPPSTHPSSYFRGVKRYTYYAGLEESIPPPVFDYESEIKDGKIHLTLRFHVTGFFSLLGSQSGVQKGVSVENEELVSLHFAPDHKTRILTATQGQRFLLAMDFTEEVLDPRWSLRLQFMPKDSTFFASLREAKTINETSRLDAALDDLFGPVQKGEE